MMVQSLEGKNDVIIISLNGTVGVVTLGGWDMGTMCSRLSPETLRNSFDWTISCLLLVKEPILTRDKEKRGKN